MSNLLGNDLNKLILLTYFRLDQLAKVRRVNKFFDGIHLAEIANITKKYQPVINFWEEILQNQNKFLYFSLSSENIFGRKDELVKYNDKKYQFIHERNKKFFAEYPKFFKLDWFTNDLVILFYLFYQYPIPIFNFVSYDKFVEYYQLINTWEPLRKLDMYPNLPQLYPTDTPVRETMGELDLYIYSISARSSSSNVSPIQPDETTTNSILPKLNTLSPLAGLTWLGMSECSFLPRSPLEALTKINKYIPIIFLKFDGYDQIELSTQGLDHDRTNPDNHICDLYENPNCLVLDIESNKYFWYCGSDDTGDKVIKSFQCFYENEDLTKKMYSTLPEILLDKLIKKANNKKKNNKKLDLNVILNPETTYFMSEFNSHMRRICKHLDNSGLNF
jgi:hypothetical protein